MNKKIIFKIMYNPKTLEIKGSTDGEVSMFLPNGDPYPYVETEKHYHSLANLAIEKKTGCYPKLKILKGKL